ncbi:alanine--tRNA ligase [Spiroplasma platyhelix]|uniref:Alanine--tRNA ligase n=1 Tax=Spiroplasma platyhelix PALS-1 TaxID=1276218 RepID=A0A846U8C0_9MOLU|nr:alanine--tRNA ligase [Spiroplasma platyhelix]MBE4703770.1 Alanine--tRNA ligase [Spiroplasma platyhelix PALS-1]NKE38143.1 alanine--tRNA ligase [Spiroplasma platyhelix PALS-1]UJB29028.1 alanyl-tRNA synthetase [Spiroplasma platyhelix PALS-1]
MKWTTDKLRATWLEFFKAKNHHVLPTASLVPNDDPSLLWINSGVANLKPYFEGKKTPPSLRLVNSQKAIRTNDIENVGYTSRHHTFFEMLGNFSIGDYFKEEAIIWAWEFLTDKQWLNFSKEKLYITVFEDDQETYDIWLKQIKVKKDHIILGTRKTNFWDMGQGPCGPNTEIYYDRGPKYDKKKIGLKLLIDDIENDRYIEIWNIVFSQFNNDGFNNYTDLPRKNIDTGAGLERIISILQDVPTNFDTDLFQAIIKKCQTLTKYRYDINNYFKNDEQQSKINTAFKIISDHIRCLTFAISDGVFPSAKTRGYILRRLIRRAEIYGQKLDINKPFLYFLVPTVVKQMGSYYPELKAKQDLIVTVVQNEEIKFWQTLVSGKELLLKVIKEEQTVSAANAFKLFDTYGFPIELTQELAQENQVSIDLAGFEKLLAQQKENARSAQGDVKALTQQNPLLVNLPLKSSFVGYKKEKIDDGEIIFIFKDNQQFQSLENTTGYVILDRTPFYAEKGGQAADAGEINGPDGYGTVLDVQSVNNLNIHYLDVSGKLTKGDVVSAVINQEKRFYTRKNHSGTHLLHAALRSVLGTHVMQSGSFNNEDYLRLDFSHFQNLSEAEMLKIEAQVATWINSATPCEVLHLTHEQALKIGALAFFGEKYESIVRVIKFGDFSIELCGGTHCGNTKEVEDLLVTNIESKGSGSYRIQALTSFKTINSFLDEKMNEIKLQVAEIKTKYSAQAKIKQDKKIEKHLLALAVLETTKEAWRIAKKNLAVLQNDFRKWQKDVQVKLEQEEEAKYLKLKPELTKNSTYLLTHEFKDFNLNSLKNLTDHYRNRYDNIVIIFLNHLSATNETLIVLAISKQLADNNYHAKEMLLTILKWFQGKGGGTNLLSQGKIEGIVRAKDIVKVLEEQ